MDYRTFNQWSSAGYKILKGSKATWIDDIPMFSEKQVTKTVKPDYGNHWKNGSGYWAQDYEDATFDEWMGGYF